MIGKRVKVIIDRPLGTYHPQFPTIYYSVNYGYIEEIIAGDGEYQDAYILGIEEPIAYFEGNVIAIVHRYNDVEDKFIVVPDGVFYTIDEIRRLIIFQEKYFDIEIYM